MKRDGEMGVIKHRTQTKRSFTRYIKCNDKKQEKHVGQTEKRKEKRSTNNRKWFDVESETVVDERGGKYYKEK